MKTVRFTTRAKVLAAFLSGALFALLVVNVMGSWQGAKCEAIYDAYTNSANGDDLDSLATEALNNSCSFAALPNGEYPYTLEVSE